LRSRPLRLIVALLTMVWALAQWTSWRTALGGRSDLAASFTSRAEERWGWRLGALADMLPPSSLTSRLLRMWASAVTPAQLGAEHRIWVDSYLLHFAVGLGLVMVLAMIVGLASLPWLLRRSRFANLDPGVALGRVWAGYVTWNFAFFFCLAVFGRSFPSDSINRSLVIFTVLQALGLLAIALTRPHLRNVLRPRWIYLCWGFGGYGLALPVAGAMGWLQSRLGTSSSSNGTVSMVANGTPLQLQELLWMVALITPIVEELWYRGALLEAVRARLGDVRALLASALFFAAIHGDPGGFFGLFGLGCVFGWLYLRTGSVVPGIVAHGLWNATSFLLVRLAMV
jgi:membrane protease YdiL (CAAX protease family)